MKNHLTKVLSVFMVFAMLLGSVAMTVVNARAYTYIAHGIDVSAWQGNINWTSVKADGVDFAILRIMASGKDKYFEANYTNAKAAGVKLGVYCYSYADTVAGAQAEANKVLSWLNGRTLEYPIYYDIEDAKQSALTKAQRTELCIAFCDVIEAAGYRAGIYSGSYWFNNYLDRATLTARYEIWEAMWPASGGVQVNKPIYDKSSTCGLWQYSSTGSVAGISGRVDMNVSYKDYASYMILNGYNGYGNTVATVTPGKTAAPKEYGWQWPASEAYGYMGNYGGNGQDIELSVDLALLSSSDGKSSVCTFYTDGTSKSMSVSQTTVTVGSTTKSYNWGALGLDNWHNVKFKIYNGTGYVFIDGVQIASEKGMTANEAYQLLFCLTGEMAIDNAILMSSTGTVYFNCNFEDEAQAKKLMGEGLGKRTLLGSVDTITPSDKANPQSYGWQWPANEAYGYIGNYGGNGQDIELSVDLCLLPSSDGKNSVCTFYTDGTTKSMTISPTSVTVGSTAKSYNWGTLGLDNWHNVKFKIYNGTGYVFIDGVQIASENGMTANEAYQLLFAYTGEMAIDNIIMMSSTGTVYFNCSFEDEAQAKKLMGEGLGHRSLLGSVNLVTPTMVAPYKYVWKWDESVSYGYFGHSAASANDIEFCADLCLLPSSTAPVATFYTDGTTNKMTITQNAVTVGSTTVSYNWGELSLDNWHDVKFKVLNGTGYVFIDGKLIASESGMTANTIYQLLFSYPGTMAIDNVIIMSSTGTTYFTCDYESASSTSQMQESYGERVLLLPDTSYFDVVVSPATYDITSTGSVTLTASPSAGEGHTYKWSCSNSTLANYMTTNGNTCTISVPSELGADMSATISCQVTSDGNVTQTASATLYYTSAPAPAPTINSVTPANATVTGMGSASYTVDASGDGLSYKWSSDNSTLNSYLTGTTGKTLTVNITKELAAAFEANLTCTVTNSYGKTATQTVKFTYKTYTLPEINSITPTSATITGTGSVSYVATATGEGLTYQWSSSNAFLNQYMIGADTSKMTINIPADIEIAFNATIQCKITDVNGKTANKSASFSYAVATYPVISSITPISASIEDTGSVKFTAEATGDGLTYKWTSSDSALNKYLSGVNTKVLTVSIPEELTENISATLTLTVTNAYGKTATATAQFEYTFTPENEPTVIMIGDLSGDGYITSADINILKRVVGGSANISTELFSAADVNGDGNVTALDCNILARYIAGVITEF